MKLQDDPFISLAAPSLVEDDDFESLQQRPVSPPPALPALAPVVGRLQGFDLSERPVVGALACRPGGVFPARATVALRRAMVGREVLVVFENGEMDKPIIVGVIEPHALQEAPAPTATAARRGAGRATAAMPLSRQAEAHRGQGRGARPSPSTPARSWASF